MIVLSDILASFGTYYGMDWMSMLLGFYGGFLIARHRRYGFVFLILSMLFAIATSVIAEQYGFIVANCINICIAVYGFQNWKNKDIKNF